MPQKGKTIKMYLIDGQPNGRMQCELSNWTGKAYRIPRKLIKLSDDRSDLDQPGVYILLGKDNAGKDMAYIGESDGIRVRLKQHIAKKDFWNEAIFFISKDNNLNKAHVKFLERKLYDIAAEVGRYVLGNRNIPGGANICESDQAEMEEFIDNLKILINALGVKIFEPVRETAQTEAESAKNTFFAEGPRGAHGKGESTSEGFVVLKGSVIPDSVTRSCPKVFQDLRNRLIDEGIVENFTFTRDYLFSSPSTAAAIVLGRSANGLTEWKLKDGSVLKSVE